MIGTELNYEMSDIGAIFDLLQQSEHIPAHLKRQLYFLESDQYY